MIVKELIDGAKNKRLMTDLIKKFKDLLTDRNLDVKTAIKRIDFNYDIRINDIDTWKPLSHNSFKNLVSLIHHLFSKYKVPSFMNKAWFSGLYNQDQFRNQVYINWFVHIGSGKNIRTAEDLPTPLTKKMAHYFLQAPKNSGILEAIRWGQTLSLGGDPFVAKAILGTRLAEDFVNDEFWLSVIRFFINNPMLDKVHYLPIIDWIYAQKFAAVLQEDGTMRAIQPNLSMHHRNPETLLKEVENWHQELGKAKTVKAEWKSCNIPGYRHENKEEIITIQELLNSGELKKEGEAMHHCVSSYSNSCASGKTSIWSTVSYNKSQVRMQRVGTVSRKAYKI